MSQDLRQKIDREVIAERPTRRRQAAAFEAFAIGATAVFVAMAVVAHTVPFFPIDLTVTRALQSHQGVAIATLMAAVSWLGFYPQALVLSLLAVAALFVAGLKWEAAATLFAQSGLAVGAFVKLLVLRPRPSADLVHVFRQLTSSSFPSGHVVGATTTFGFLGFLAFTLLKPSPVRTVLLVLAAIPIALMGPSRIYLGEHWFSDVMGAYLFGSVWLALAIRLYRWGKPRFFRRQPMAPEAARAHE